MGRQRRSILKAALLLTADSFLLDVLDGLIDPSTFQELKDKVQKCLSAHAECEADPYSGICQLQFELMVAQLHRDLERQSEIAFGGVSDADTRVDL